MPVLQNSIDAFEFEDLQGAVVLRRQELEIWQRPGVDGHGVRKTAERGRPFQLVSVHYVADWDATEAALVSYQALIGGDPVAVVQHSITYGNFLVLAVEQMPQTQAVFGVTGSIVANPEVLQFCRWTLLG